MNKNARSLMAYALSISMLFNTATDNQNKKIDQAILPEDMYVEEPFEENRDKVKLNKTQKMNYTK